jgi:hypothetical protein
MAKGGMAKHLSACPQRRTIIEKAGQKKAGSETLYHLQARDAYEGMFWLDLEMRGSATLEDLDQYLRAIWLECCGHMSQFSIGGWGGEEIPKGRKIDRVFEPGVELTHIYDFGTESVTKIKLMETREGKPTTRHPIALMARNLTPDVRCAECGQEATWFCQECVVEEDRPGMLCQEHAESHPHDDYGGPIEVVNSPRLGMCGYDGPADPPY